MGFKRRPDIAASDAERAAAAVYLPLQDHPPCAENSHSKLKVIAAICGCVVFVLSLVAVTIYLQSQSPFQITKLQNNDEKHSDFTEETAPISNISVNPVMARGVAEGVSAKSYPSLSTGMSYNWTNEMFSWQRTAFHFQPEKNWMNDPDGPLFHKGWYHLFYQYNPESAVWGNISWGHAVSRDLIHWLYLPIAMVPDTWYDVNGVWTGSATILPDGKIVMLYTGSTDKYVQVQNLAYPANLSDPLLLDWIKYPGNPVMVHPPGIGPKDFRDPTTAWLAPDGKWRLTLGSRKNKTGISLVYTTSNFTQFELLDNLLHAVPGTGMWECVDFFPVSKHESNGLDTSVHGPGTKHVLKASLDETKVDHYAIGTYHPHNDTWVPDNPDLDVGIGLKLDYGRYYASKTFYDLQKHRRILWGWINETDTEGDDLAKGWASVQTIPRTVVFDTKTQAHVLQWPVEEIESLRLRSREFDGVLVKAGSVVPLDIGPATQLDILAEFEVENLVGSKVMDRDGIDCGDGAMHRSALGPFGLLVIADDTLSELTPVYFRPANTINGTADTFFCTDTKRSSEAPGVFKVVYGSKVPVLSDEKLSMRVLVDHSIIESFGQGGRTVITSRIYPTKAIYGAARVFLFNNATDVNVKANLKIWDLNSAFIRPFPFHENRADL